MAISMDAPGRTAAFSWQRQPVDPAIDLYVLRGYLDAATTPKLREEVRPIVDDGQRHSLIFDLMGLTFVDSVGLGLFFACHRSCQRLGGAVALVSPQEVVRGTLEHAGLTRTLHIEPTRTDAIILLSRLHHNGA
jgi:anti-anti-sigma factor